MGYGDKYQSAPADKSKRCASCIHRIALADELPPWDSECIHVRRRRGLVTVDWGCADHEPQAEHT